MSNFTAYDKGNRAFYKGVPFWANPYKMPGKHVDWALGWMDARKRPKTGVVNKKMRKHYGG